MAQVEPINQTGLTEIALAGIIAEAVSALDSGIDKWMMYEYAKCDIRDMELTPDQYQRAIKLLTEALKI